jgi:hypothetical protein
MLARAAIASAVAAVAAVAGAPRAATAPTTVVCDILIAGCAAGRADGFGFIGGSGFDVVFG